MKNQVLRSWVGKSVILTMLLTTAIYAANFAGGTGGDSGYPFYHETGSDDNYASAWTYVSFDYTNNLYVETQNWYSTSSDSPPYTFYNGISSTYTDSLDDGVLWSSGTNYFGLTEIWFSFNDTDFYLGAYAEVYH